MSFPISTKLITAIGLILIALIEIIKAVRGGSWRDLFTYLQSTRWKTGGLYLLGIMMIILPIIFLDPFIRPFMKSLSHPYFDGYIEMGRYLGRNIWFCLIIAYALTFILARRKLSPWIFGALLGTSLTGLATHIFKYIFMRARPDADLGYLHFFAYQNGLPHVKSYLSMPSGDVAIVTGAAAFLICSLRKGWARWLLLVFPIATAFSRIQLNRHWPSDTLASILLSFLIGHWLANYKATAHTQTQK